MVIKKVSVAKKAKAKATSTRGFAAKIVSAKSVDNVQDDNSYGIASLILGIASIIIPILGIVAGILAIIFAGKQKRIRPNGMSTAGLVLGIIGLVFQAIAILAVIFVISIFSMFAANSVMF